MSLVTLPMLRAIVRTSIDDTLLQTIIDREEAEVVRRFGTHAGDGAITATLQGGKSNVCLGRAIGTVSSITEASTLGATPTTLTSSDYYTWAGQGRIQRLPEGQCWGRVVTISYTPADDNALRRQVIIELVRLAVEQTAMRHESVAQEYLYDAPDWEATRVALYRRLGLRGI